MLPAHTPTADVLVMTYGEPDDISGDTDLINMDRVGWAFDALTPFHRATMHSDPPSVDEPWAGTDAESAIVDLICDLMHLATYVGLDPEAVLSSGRMHFECEVGRGYDQ